MYRLRQKGAYFLFYYNKSNTGTRLSLGNIGLLMQPKIVSNL